ncbi:MAG: hypothetical protein AAAB19_10740 [Rhizobium sp.]|jgi:hypothetical protein
MAQVSGEIDRVFHDVDRAEAIGSATELARHRAISAGTEEATLETLDVDDTPLSYIPGNPIRVRVIGDLKI